MNNQEFDSLLTKIHEEIERTETIDAGEKELLLHIQKDIRALLDRSKDQGAAVRSPVFQSLQDSIDQLEIEHPTLTALMERLSEMLSNAGL